MSSIGTLRYDDPVIPSVTFLMKGDPTVEVPLITRALLPEEKSYRTNPKLNDILDILGVECLPLVLSKEHWLPTKIKSFNVACLRYFGEGFRPRKRGARAFKDYKACRNASQNEGCLIGAQSAPLYN